MSRSSRFLTLSCLIGVFLISLIVSHPAPVASALATPSTMAATVAAAPGNDPASVIKASQVAVNAHNTDAAAALFAADAVVTTAGGTIYNGLPAIRGWLQTFGTINFHLDPGTLQASGDVVVTVDKVSIDPWRTLGVAPLDNISQAVVTGGKIKSLVVNLTPQAAAKLGAALAKAPQGTDAVSVARAEHVAANAHNVDAAVAFFADDAVVTISPPPRGSLGVFSGKDAIKAWVQTDAANHLQVENVFTLALGPDTAIARDKISLDQFRQLGVAPLDFVEQYVVQAGKIKSMVISLTPEAAAKLGAAIAQMPTAPATPAK